jgi:hypothetical protein
VWYLMTKRSVTEGVFVLVLNSVKVNVLLNTGLLSRECDCWKRYAI